MKKFAWLIMVLAFLGVPVAAQTYEKIQGYCEKGGEQVTTDGRTSTTRVQRSYPSCTITVYDTGTTNLASIASNSGGTPKPNPFTADSDGYWSWFALDGVYDVKMSGGGLLSPVTRSGFWIVTSSGGGGGITGSGTTNRFPIFTSSTAIGNSVFQQVGTAEFAPATTGKRINLGTGSQQVVEIANAGTGGTTTYRLAKLTGAPSTALTATTSDTSKIVGIVIAGAGTTGNAQIVQNGNATCEFDGATTAGNYVGASTTLAGRCSDLGSALPTSGVQVIGRVIETIASAGNASVYTFTGEQHTSGLGGSGTTGYMSYWTSSSGLGASNLLYDTAGQILQSGYSFDIQNGGLSELTLETDQVIIKGGVNRATSAHVVQVKGVASQSGDYFKAIDSASSTKFRIRSTGQPSFGGVNYTFPSLPATTSCLQISSAGVISTVSCVTGTVPLQVQAYNVKNDGGCIGDGVTNDTTCVAAAYTAAIAASRPLYFPSGTYLVDGSTIIVATNSVTIFGDGPGRSTIKNRTNGSSITLDNSSAITHSVRIRDLSLSGAGSSSADIGITVSGSANEPFGLTVSNVTIGNMGGKGIYVSNNLFTSRFVDIDVSVLAGGTNGIDISGGSDIVLERCYVHTVGTGGAAYRIHAGVATLIGCNGIDSGLTSDWIVLGDSTGTGDPTDRYARINLIGTNIEAFTNRGVYAKSGSYVNKYEGVTILAPATGTVTPIKYDFVDTGQRGTWDAASSINTQGAAYTNSKAINSSGAPFVQIGSTAITDYYDTGAVGTLTLPYVTSQLVAGSTNIAMLTSRAQITALEASGLVGDLTGASGFTGSTSRVLLQSGTAARPTFTFGTDTDTGFYNSAANTIGFSGGGASLGSLASTGLTLGIPGTTVGALILGNASNAFTTTLQSGVAAASRTYTLPTNFGVSGSVLTDAAGNGTLSWVVPSSSLTATYVGYGSAGNALTGTNDLTYNTTTKVLTVSTGTGVPYLFLNGGSDAAAVKINAGVHPGNGGGLILPFVGGGMSTGPGIWWCANDYASCSGFYKNNGLTYQGANSTHDKFKLAEGTGTSSNGTVRYMWEPSSSLLTQMLSTGTTAAAHIMEDTTVTSTGATAANFGVRENTTIENASGSNVLAVGVEKVWTVATGGAETARVEFLVRNQGSSATRSFTIDGLQNYATVSNLGNKSGSFTVDFSLGNYATMTATGNFATVTFSNIKAGAKYVLKITQDGTGGRTWTPPTTFKYPGGIAGNILTGTANAVDVFICETFDGSNLWCNGLFDVKNP